MLPLTLQTRVHLAKRRLREQIMSNVKRILCSSLEFNQIALFSMTGLGLSLALAFTCNLGIAAQWI
jgi:hypothetical protein